MALTKQNLSIPFSEGLDTKTDPWQVMPGKFLSLKNSVFTKGKQLRKRSAFVPITALPDGASATTLTTFNGNLTAIGTSLFAYSQASNEWEDKGRIQSVDLSTLSLVRTAYSNSAQDAVISGNGLVCTVFLDGDGLYKYTVADAVTSQSLVNITNLPATSNQARVFLLGTHFMITFFVLVGATPHLRYIAIPLYNLSNPSAPTDISAQVFSTTTGYDGFVANNNLYIAWNGSDVGGAIRVTYIDTNVTQHNTIVLPGHTSTLMSVTADITSNTPVVWVSAYVATDTYTYALSPALVVISGPTHLTSGDTLVTITSTAQNMLLTFFYEVQHSYSFGPPNRTDFIRKVTCTQAGTVGTPAIVDRSVGLASKAFLFNGTSYMLTAYAGVLEPTYFLIDELGNVIARLAFANGAGYRTTQVLPNISLFGNVASTSYLLKDLLIPVNKQLNPTSVNGVYAQTGVNLVNFDLSSKNLVTAEIGNNLHITGGFLWMYDGVKPVEHGFHLYPEDIVLTTSTTGGSMSAQVYNYQVVYEWTDGQGNIHRSAPSIPLSITTTGATSTVTLNIPTLRLTYKITPNAIRIVIYRWSAAQEIFYQITSVTAPLLNNPAVDSVTYVDTQADSSIVGNNIIYTTGGVVENIAAPACSVIALYKSRLMIIDAEDRNLLWYSKQVVESTPVETSDLFTIFVSPSSGAQGSTGVMTALAPLDDKLVPFKRDAIYYITGNGPDNLGNNNDFSDPVFITSTVGSTNQQSIAFIPQGLTFQSDKGIWLLGRDLSTQYIGAPVERYNDNVVLSATAIPSTNQVRFTLSTAISSTLYQNKHTVLNSFGDVLQETEGEYVDGQGGLMLMYDYFYGQWGTFELNNGPVLLQFTTSWLNLAGVQGFERAYFFYILGQFYSPHKLSIGVAYDYNSSPSQSLVITPDNYAPPYGDVSPYGAEGSYGGTGDVEQWRIFMQKQKCQAFQLSLSEVFDPSFGTMPGAGLAISGLNLVVGMKKSYVPIKASRSAS